MTTVSQKDDNHWTYDIWSDKPTVTEQNDERQGERQTEWNGDMHTHYTAHEMRLLLLLIPEWTDIVLLYFIGL